MYGSKKSSRIIVTLVAALFSWSTAATARTAHVHAGPGPTWARTLEIPSGAHVQVGSCKAGWGHHDWCKVTYRGKTGFIHEGALRPFGKHAIVSPVITTEAVALRSRPSQAAGVTTRLARGEQINVAHCSDGWLKGWCRVNHEGHSGFVKGNSLRHD
jgi:uncharacterized protein YraI